MADQKLNIELDANAEPLLDALATVDEHLVNITDGVETASQSLKNIEAAGELVAESAEKVASGVDSVNGKLDDLNTTAAESGAKLDGIKDVADKTADGVKELGDKAEVANEKLDDIKDSSKRAADGIGDIGVSSRAAAQNVSKAEKTIKDALAQIENNVRRTSFDKLADKTIRFTSVVSALKKTANILGQPLKKAIEQLQEIGEKARDLGTSASYFQKLERSAEQSNEKFEDVQAVFKKINETAKKALSGDADAAKKLENIGIAVDDLRGKSPEQVFEHVAGALAAAGDEAINSEAAAAVCGDRLAEIGDNLADLANTEAKIPAIDIIPDEAVQASMELKENFSKLGQELLVLIAQSGLVDWLASAARFVGGIKDDIKEIKETRQLVEQGEVHDRGKEYNDRLKGTAWETGKNALNIATLGLGYIPKLWGGRSLGASLMGYQKEGVDLYTDPFTREEARREKKKQQEQTRSQKQQGTRTRQAINASTPTKTDKNAEQQTAREEERRRLQTERERQRAEQQAAKTQSQGKSKKRKKLKRRSELSDAVSQPLSTAGSISDPKQARIQRSHELKLAKETAKQKITVKVKNKGTKASTIAKAITSAVGGLLHSADNHLQGIQSNLGNLRPVSPDTLSAVHQVAQGPLQGQSRQTQTALAQANQSGDQSTDPTQLMSEILTAVKDLKTNTYVVR